MMKEKSQGSLLKDSRQNCIPFGWQSEQEITQEKANQGGWALLGLMLALAILSIVLVSSVTPNYQIAVQREKEAEMVYRGQQMAEGIARWYNNGGGPGGPGPVQLRNPPVYGFLKELKKLSEGVKIGVREVKFVRPSAIIDPMTNEEWEPVYARDPRLMPFLQAWSGDTGGVIPPEYLLIAAPPVNTRKLIGSSDPSEISPKPLIPGQSGTSSDQSGSTGQSTDQSTGQSTGQQGTVTGKPGQPIVNKKPNTGDDDDDDDEEDGKAPNDPLAHLFQQSGLGKPPIVGVAPKRKGPAVHPYFGLKNYEEWVFIYIPLAGIPQQLPNQNRNQNQNQADPPLKISQ